MIINPTKPRCNRCMYVQEKEVEAEQQLSKFMDRNSTSRSKSHVVILAFRHYRITRSSTYNFQQIQFLSHENINLFA